MSRLWELLEALPSGRLVTSLDELEPFRYDRAQDPGAGTPLAVVPAETTEDVRAAVLWATRHRIPVVARGAGSGLSGGASAVDGCLVVSTAAMRTCRIDPLTRTAVVQPGVLNVELKARAAELGLWYPPDPASYEFCTIGGNVATNAGGLCCVKYGVTTDYVLGLEVVLADGRVLKLGGPRLKDVAGLSLVKLFVGSEGTLGIITEVTLRLLPAPPVPRTVVAWFADSAAAAAAVLAVAATTRPAMLELMDQTAVGAVEDVLRMGLRRDAAALVLAQSDDQHPTGGEIAAMLAAFQQHGAIEAFETSPEEGDRFAHARRIAIPAMEKRGRLLLEDVGVPLPQLDQLIRGVEAISRARETTIAFIAHAGDGNTHPLVLFDPDDSVARVRAEAAYGEVMDLALELSGTITGEHGVGRLKRPWLVRQIGADVLDVSERVKRALDPEGILNPGVIFDPIKENAP